MLITLFSGFLVFAKRSALAPETFKGSVGSVLVGLCASALFLWIGYLSIFRARKVREGKSGRFGYFTLLFVAYFMAMFNAVVALTTAQVIAAESSGRAIVGVVALWSVGMLIAVSATLRSKPQLVGTDETPDECWKWGMIYYNPEDPAFLVEKRIGYGWTLNCGNKWSWIFIAAILAGPFILRYFWFMNG